MDFSNINFLAVLVAAIASFALGALWYTSILFGKAWQKELGYTDEYLQSGNMPLTFGTSFVMMLLMALGMAGLLGAKGGEIGWAGGLQFGLLVGLFFAATSIAINYVYQRKSLKLWLIDAVYQVLIIGIMGAIIGAW